MECMIYGFRINFRMRCTGVCVSPLCLRKLLSFCVSLCVCVPQLSYSYQVFNIFVFMSQLRGLGFFAASPTRYIRCGVSERCHYTKSNPTDDHSNISSKKLQKQNIKPLGHYRCHYTKSNPTDDHSNISSKKLQKQNFKPLGHYTCMQCGTYHLQTVQENILSHIILATYRKFTVATVRFTQNVSWNIYTHPIYQQVANITV